MFGIGFWELVLIGVIALIVLGPERLPVVARNAGRAVARLRRTFADWTSEFDSDDSIRELKRELAQLRDEVQNSTSVGDIKDEVDRARRDINHGIHEFGEDIDDRQARDEPTSGMDAANDATTDNDEEDEEDEPFRFGADTGDRQDGAPQFPAVNGAYTGNGEDAATSSLSNGSAGDTESEPFFAEQERTKAEAEEPRHAQHDSVE